MRILILFGFLMILSQNSLGDIYEDAVANTQRSDKDKALDSRRKPAEVMRFFGIQPGMKVFDVFAGGGYYTELLSLTVGQDGFVTLYNNAPWNNFVAEGVASRLKDNRLANVKNLVAPPESLVDLKPEHDAAIFILGMHDIYYADKSNQWPLIEKEKFLKGIYGLLKSGGVLGVIDANAKSGADPAISGKTVHRVDPAVIIRDLESVGFKLEAQSNILSNEDDDLTSSVFRPENRYKTNRSVLKFRK